MIIPHRMLSPEALQGVVEDFVTREGTDYGVHEADLKRKVAQVRKQLDNGTALILFNEQDASCTIVSKDHVPEECQTQV